MHIELSGHHVDITEGIREAVNSKLSKIQSHYPQISSLTVILTVEPNSQSVEITTQFLGCAIAVQASDSDLYAAIAAAVKKLDAKLSHKKGATQSHRHDKPEITEPEVRTGTDK